MSLLQALTSRMAGTKTYAGAIDLDGTNDYLSRASDFTGNADGKTFTFSAWVWNTSSAQGDFYKSSSRFRIDITNSNLRITGQDSGANPILIYTSANFKSQVEIGTFYHVLMSIDLTNASNRHVYINDVAITGGSFGTYTNANIDFTNTAHGIGENFKGRLSHVYLDYTYRDLSNSTNRRLFITADRKPAQGQAALNPILYLPMDDPTTAHINQGTGGNFTLNGVVARSGRGPNQFNAPYSKLLNTSVNYLTRASGFLNGVDGRYCTVAFCFIPTQQTNIISRSSEINISHDFNRKLSFYYSPDNLVISVATVKELPYGRNYTCVASWDSQDAQNTFKCYVNGELYAVTGTFTNRISNPFGMEVTNIGYYPSANSLTLGNLYFNTTYIDLSVASNLAKFVTGTGIDAKPADLGANGELPTGTAPLIYLPMYGNNAGKNYGTGGDFTVNSGPYVGSRGPNEFWGNKADFDGSTGWLKLNSVLTGVSDSKTVSMSFWFSPDGSGGTMEWFNFSISTSATTYRFVVARNSSNQLQITARTAAGTTILSATTASAGFTAGSSNYVQMSFDLSNASNRGIYINGAADSVTWTTYSNTAIPFSSTDICRIAANNTGAELDGKLSEFYFTTDYIDFSLEANRLLFRDAFGNPTDLPSLIESGAVPNPAVYMRFDPANQGLNSGTGGNFTKSGTITDGGQL